MVIGVIQFDLLQLTCFVFANKTNTSLKCFDVRAIVLTAVKAAITRTHMPL